MNLALSKTLFAVLLVRILSPSLYAAGLPAAISFEVSGESVHATGLTPEGPVAVICAWRITNGDFSHASQSWREASATQSGEIQVTFANPIPSGAFIAVIDVESGRVGMTTNEATTFEQVDLPSKRLRRDAGGEVVHVLSPNEAVLLIVMRRGEGVWARAAHDGGAGDADQALDGRITTDPAGLLSIAGSSAAPKKIRPHDFVLVIDKASRQFASTEVTP